MDIPTGQPGERYGKICTFSNNRYVFIYYTKHYTTYYTIGISYYTMYHTIVIQILEPQVLKMVDF